MWCKHLFFVSTLYWWRFLRSSRWENLVLATTINYHVKLILIRWPLSVFIGPTCRDVLWYGAGVCLSVRPSVCLSIHKACKQDTDWTVPARTFKLGTITTYDKRTNRIDFQGQGSKVKVTCNTLLNLVNTIQTEPFKLEPSNLVHILRMTRGRHLLISKVRGQRSRSHVIHCC